MTKQDLINEIQASILWFHKATRHYQKSGARNELPPDVSDYVRRVMIAVEKFIKERG